jgi:hypothetical protein
MATGKAPSAAGKKKTWGPGIGLPPTGDGPSVSNVPPAPTGGAPGLLDNAVYDETFGLLRDLVTQSKQVGSQQNFDLAANRLRERAGQVANQQRGQLADNFVSRGLGGSAAMYGKDYMGQVDRTEQQAMIDGLLGLQSQQTQNQISSLGLLNNALAGYMNLGELGFNANALAAKLLQDQDQFNTSLNWQKKQSKKDEKYRDKQSEQMDNETLMRLLEGLGFFY